mgnify:CR=1 FL=1
MNISLPDTLKSFVDEQVSQRGYGTSSEYVRELIRKDQDRQQLRGLLLAGVDVIGDCITEINVTSPTCFQEIFDQTGCDVAALFVDALEAAVAQAS